MQVFTIGHSTRSLEEFVLILRNFRINMLVDVRRFPSSKKFPHFDKENLQQELPKSAIEYLHYPELGGFRKEGYQNFALSEEFATAINNLLKIIGNKIACIMCAEILFFRCHRRYVAESLVALGNKVVHIYGKDKTQEHKLRMPEMEVKIFCDKIKKLNS